MPNFKKIIYIIIILLLIFASGYFTLRYQFYLRYYDEIIFTKTFWTEVIKNDTPSKELLKYLRSDCIDRFEHNFYAYKVWFITFSPTKPDSKLLKAENASMIYRTTNNKRYQTTDIGVTFKYGDERQTLQVVLIKENGQYRLCPSLSLDNCMWSPDLNEDGIVDNFDVIIAKNKKKDT
jgi:hypothetical protein